MRKTALITGASGGIGAEMAKLMALQNYDLFVVDLREDLLDDLTKSLLKNNPNITVQALAVDLCEENIADQIYEKVKSENKNIEVLINNAGFGTLGFFTDIDWEREKRMIRLHVEALTHLTKLFVKDMVGRGSGRILNVSSVAGFQPSPLMAVYNATKAYILSFSEAIANEVKGTGVTVTVLCPGLTRTGFQKFVGIGDPGFTKSKWFSDSAELVAMYGIKSMEKGKIVAVPGILNKFFANAYRFLPRHMVAQAVRKVQERNRSFLNRTK